MALSSPALPGATTAPPVPAGSTADAAGTSRRPASRPGGFLPSLTGLRGLMSCSIFAVHLAPFAMALTPAVAGVWAAYWHNAAPTLDMFFVLSGFVLSAAYGRRFAGWPGGREFVLFLWTRLSRFYPLHLAVLAALVGAVLLAAAVGVPLVHGGDLGGDLAAHLLLLHGWGGADALSWNGPSWSLSTEWACYLLFPLLAPAVLRIRSTTGAVLAYVGAYALPMTAYALLGFDEAPMTFEAPLFRVLGGFVAGAVLFRLTRVSSHGRLLAGRRTDALAVVCVLVVVALALAGLPAYLAVPLTALLVLGLSVGGGVLDGLLSSAPFQQLGDVSVSLFLTHVPFLMLGTLLVTPERFPGAWGWLGVALLAVGGLLVAGLARALVQRPGQRAMRRIADARSDRSAAPPVRLPGTGPTTGAGPTGADGGPGEGHGPAPHDPVPGDPAPHDPVLRDPVHLELVVPVYNEADRLPRTLEAMLGQLGQAPWTSRIVVVDNGSCDDTLGHADRLGPRAAAAGVDLVVIGCSRPGKGAAVRRGMLSSCARYVGFADADLSTPVATVTAAVDALDAGATAAIASRRADGADLVHRQPLGRRLGGAAFRRLTRPILPGVADTQCGFKVFDREPAQRALRRGRSTDFSFDVELLRGVRDDGGRIVELPVAWRDDVRSSFRPLRDGLPAFRSVLELQLSLWRRGRR